MIQAVEQVKGGAFLINKNKYSEIPMELTLLDTLVKKMSQELVFKDYKYSAFEFI